MLGPVDIKKQNIDSPPEAPTIPATGNIVSTLIEGEEYAKKKIAEILGEDVIKEGDSHKAQALYDYAKDKGAKSVEDVLWEIRYLGNRLGTPGYGESRLSFLYEYVYLLKEGRNITDKMKKMEVLNA